MGDPNTAEFDTFNIPANAAVNREAAKRAYDQALAWRWENSEKGELLELSSRKPLSDKYASTIEGFTDYARMSAELASSGMASRGEGAYSDLYNDVLVKNSEWFSTATDEEIREKLAPPNDIGKYAQEVFDQIVSQIAKQNALIEDNQRPDTAASNEIEEQKNAEKCAALQEQIDQAISLGMEAEGTVADCEDVAEKAKRAAKLAEADKKAKEEQARVAATVQPAKSLEFKQQNFIQAKIIDIIKHRHSNSYRDPEKQKEYPYIDGSPNACIMVHGDPSTCINDLLIYSDTDQFLRMRSEEIANLQPEIRLFKTITDIEEGEDKNIEMFFDTHLTQRNLESLLTNKKKRATGVGIKDFQLKFVGTDPFAANKSFKATLKIYAASFDELFQPRGMPGARYRYIDLALKTSKALSEPIYETENAHKMGVIDHDLARLDFSLKVKLGIKKPKRTTNPESDMSVLSRNTITLNLTPTVHRFDFNEDGSLMFEIDYLPFNDQRFSGTNFDVFTNQKMRALNLKMKIATESAKANCDEDLSKALKKQHVDDLKDIRTEAISSIIQNLHSKKRVNYLQVDPEVLEKFNENASNLTFADVLKLSEKAEFLGSDGTPEALEEDIKKDAGGGKKKDRIKTKVNSPTIPTIPYVFISDIIDVVLGAITVGVSPAGLHEQINKVLQELQIHSGNQAEDINTVSDLRNQLSNATDGAEIFRLAEQINDVEANIDDRAEKRRTAFSMIDEYSKDTEDFRKFRVVLGSIELVNPFDANDVLIASIGDVPVTIAYLQEWMMSETLKDGITKISLSGFLNKLIMKLVKNCLNDDSSFGGALKQKVRIAKTEAFCVNRFDEKIDDLTYTMMRTNKAFNANMSPEYLHEYYSGEDGSDGADIDPEFEFKTSRAYLNYMNTPALGSAESGYDPAYPRSAREEMNYLVFYSGRVPPIGHYSGNRLDDAERGVHHYSVGRDRGIIKTISLTRDNRPGIREARFEQEGFDGLSQLREVYNVDVKSFANFNVFPGTKIFVDPQGWVPNLDSETMAQLGGVRGLTDFGIGGYYDIMQVTHTFGVGQFDTEFTAKWVAQIGSPRKLKRGKNPNERSESKCKVSRIEEDAAHRAAARENIRDMVQGVGEFITSSPSRLKALSETVVTKLVEDNGGFLEKVPDFFGNPSDAP
jgi:hypothetical protein